MQSNAKNRIPLWLREVGHFFGLAIAIWVLSYLAEANLPYWASIIVRFVLFWLAMFVTFHAEFREYREQRQDQNKTLWDLIAKSGGIIVASLTAGWWREL